MRRFLLRPLTSQPSLPSSDSSATTWRAPRRVPPDSARTRDGALLIGRLIPVLGSVSVEGFAVDRTALVPVAIRKSLGVIGSLAIAVFEPGAERRVMAVDLRLGRLGIDPCYAWATPRTQWPRARPPAAEQTWFGSAYPPFTSTQRLIAIRLRHFGRF